MIANIHGRFDRWEGTLEFDPDAPTQSRVRVQIEAASVDTRELQRDAHLRSAEFFNTENFPHMTFESTQIERLTLDNYEVTGELTVRGTARPVVLAVLRSAVIVDHAGNQRVGFAVSGTISRRDFGLTWNRVLETGGVMVGDRVAITAELEAVRLPEIRQVPDGQSDK